MKKLKIPKGFILGALVGGVSALLFSPRSGRENRKLIEKKIKELEIKLRDPKNAEEIQKLLMKVTKDAPAKYVEIKKEIIKNFNKAKIALEKIEYTKYVDMIDKIVQEVLKTTKTSEKAILDIKNKLLSLWSDDTKNK